MRTVTFGMMALLTCSVACSGNDSCDVAAALDTCSGNNTCDATTKKCVARPSCTKDADCADGYTCSLSTSTCFRNCNALGKPSDSLCQKDYTCSGSFQCVSGMSGGDDMMSATDQDMAMTGQDMATMAAALPKGQLVYDDNSGDRTRVWLLGTGGAMPSQPLALTGDDAGINNAYPAFTKDDRVVYTRTSGSAPAYTSSLRVINLDGTGDAQVFDCGGVMSGSFCRHPVQGSNDLIYFEQVSGDTSTGFLTPKLLSIAASGGSPAEVETLPDHCPITDLVVNAPRGTLLYRISGNSCGSPGMRVRPLSGNVPSPMQVPSMVAPTFNAAGDRVALAEFMSGNVSITTTQFDGAADQTIGTYKADPGFYFRVLPGGKHALVTQGTTIKWIDLTDMGSSAATIPNLTAPTQAGKFDWRAVP